MFNELKIIIEKLKTIELKHWKTSSIFYILH